MVTCKKTSRGGETYATRKNVLGTMLSAVTARSTPTAPEFPGTIKSHPQGQKSASATQEQTK